MLSPKRTKFRKYHRGKMRGKVFLSLICYYNKVIRNFYGNQTFINIVIFFLFVYKINYF
jgi:hypothetical protein